MQKEIVVRPPGVEPGSRAWEAPIITARPRAYPRSLLDLDISITHSTIHDWPGEAARGRQQEGERQRERERERGGEREGGGWEGAQPKAETAKKSSSLKQKRMEKPGIDPGACRMRSDRSTK